MNYNILTDDSNPITITEELLIKFGAYIDTIISDNDVLLIDVNEAISIGWCGYLFLVIDAKCIFLDVEYTYVHQLKNLYHILAGVELTIK